MQCLRLFGRSSRSGRTEYEAGGRTRVLGCLWLALAFACVTLWGSACNDLSEAVVVRGKRLESHQSVDVIYHFLDEETEVPHDMLQRHRGYSIVVRIPPTEVLSDERVLQRLESKLVYDVAQNRVLGRLALMVPSQSSERVATLARRTYERVLGSLRQRCPGRLDEIEVVFPGDGAACARAQPASAAGVEHYRTQYRSLEEKGFVLTDPSEADAHRLVYMNARYLRDLPWTCADDTLARVPYDDSSNGAQEVERLYAYPGEVDVARARPLFEAAPSGTTYVGLGFERTNIGALMGDFDSVVRIDWDDRIRTLHAINQALWVTQDSLEAYLRLRFPVLHGVSAQEFARELSAGLYDFRLEYESAWHNWETFVGRWHEGEALSPWRFWRFLHEPAANTFGDANYLRDESAWRRLRQMALSGRMQNVTLDLNHAVEVRKFASALATYFRSQKQDERGLGMLDLSNVWLPGHAGPTIHTWLPDFARVAHPEALALFTVELVQGVFPVSTWAYVALHFGSYATMQAREQQICVVVLLELLRRLALDGKKIAQSGDLPPTGVYGPLHCRDLIPHSSR